jgi:three-Cys-motif partner protein
MTIDALPTVWPAEPHTLVKHAILGRYLKAWLPILTQQARALGKLKSQEILFIDGFAGPGEYSGGELGSPVIALKSAIEHNIEFPLPVRMLFIEHRKDRFEHLQKVLAPILEQAKASSNVHAVEPCLGDCDETLGKLLSDYEQKRMRFGPALAFLDQFGYGAVSMELIKRILSFDQCEVFSYLCYREMNRWITDPHKAPAFTRAYGGEEWKECIGLSEAKRRERLLELYKTALKVKGDAKYVVSFLMFDQNNSPLYWLLFCTNNIRGLEEMKKAMWSVDKSGDFRFSDGENPNQLKLPLLEEAYDQPWLAGELKERLSGRTMSATEIKEFVLVETPCYLFKAGLKSLETSGDATVVSAPAGRKPGTFPDDRLSEIRLRFAADMFA